VFHITVKPWSIGSICDGLSLALGKNKSSNCNGDCVSIRGALFLFGKVSFLVVAAVEVWCRFDKMYSSFGLGFGDGSELATYGYIGEGGGNG
jgi:hypothetical protein